MIIVLFLFVCINADRQNILFEAELKDKLTTAGLLQQYVSPNVLACTRMCSKRNDCVSISYIENTTICSLHNQTFVESSNSLFSSPGSKYYALKDDTVSPTATITTTQTTTTTTVSTLAPLTEGSPCPTDDSIFSPAMTSFGSFFQFRVFFDWFNNSDAIQLCESYGAKLYKIITEDKMVFTQSLLSCPAYSNESHYYYWVNGEYESPGVYKTTEGDIIQMTAKFWVDGQPNMPGVENCIYLEGSENFKFKDTVCNGTFRPICEM